jgi:Transcriptional regulatory protein, C terminal
MSSRIINRAVAGPTDSAPGITEPEATSVRRINAALGDEQNGNSAHGTRIQPNSWNEMVKIEVDVDGHPIAFRVFVNDISPSGVNSRSDVQSLFAGALEEIVDQTKGWVKRRAASSSPTSAIEETILSEEPVTQPAVSPRETELRVGSLELDLIDRVATRGGRRLDLRPCEFRLLKYMMERSDKLLTRATLLQDLWHYKFVSKTNLVDVHMGRLRRKVDGPNELPMICSVRRAGFVLKSVP